MMNFTKAACAALWISALTILIQMFMIRMTGHASERETNRHRQLARDIFRELIEINTTIKYGSTKAAEAMEARLKAAGFGKSDLKLIGPEPKHKNLVVRYRGTGKLRPILLFAHLDVVEASPGDWTTDPFVFIEKDEFFYGRGALDMKCEVADIVTNLIRLKEEGFKPKRDIIVALTEDEENGEWNGMRWLLANRRDLIDAEYAINLEGGGGVFENGKHVMMEVQTGEKIYASFRLEVKNKGGHSSIPVKDNAIYTLASGLIRLSQFNFPVRLNETTREFFGRTATLTEGRLKSDIEALLKMPFDVTTGDRVALSKPYYNALLRTTWVPTMLSGGHAENALPQSARAVVNCRMLPDEKIEETLATLRRVLSDERIIVTQIAPPRAEQLSPLRMDVMDIVEQLTASMWPGAIVTPFMSTGATDGKYLRQAGIPVYGVSGIFSDINDIRIHGKDERIGVKEFYEGVEFMYRFIKLITHHE